MGLDNENNLAIESSEVVGGLVFKKHSAIIQINNKLTAQQRKIFNFFLQTATLDGWDEKFQTRTSVKALKKALGISHKHNKFLKANIKKLNATQVEFNMLSKDKEHWGVFNLINDPEIYDGNIFFQLPKRIRETIETGQPPFALLDCAIINRLNNKYSIALYELAKDYYSSKDKKSYFPEITLEELRTLLGVEEGKYSLFKDFRKNVLEVIKQEIRDETDLNIDYLLVKNGVNYESIKFLVSESDNVVATSTPMLDKRIVSESTIEQFLKENPAELQKYMDSYEGAQKDEFRYLKVQKNKNGFEIVFDYHGFEIPVEFKSVV